MSGMALKNLATGSRLGDEARGTGNDHWKDDGSLFPVFSRAVF